MKFKTKEDLIKTWETSQNYTLGVEDSFNSFQDRINFYKKYKNKPIFFGNEKPEEWLLFVEWHNEKYACKPNYKSDEKGRIILELVFNKWLFNYCFGDLK